MRIAVVQTPGCRLDQWPDTLALLDRLVRQAAGRRAQLIVLPECAFPAYVLGSAAAYHAARSAGMPGHDAFLDRVRGWARELSVAVCAGYVEERADGLANAACLVDESGRLCGVYHKCFLWDFDRLWFSAGGALEPIESPLGCVGVMICADNRLPEIPATLAARGARLILHPTAWVNAGAGGALEQSVERAARGAGPAGAAVDPLWNPQPDFLVAARAMEFGVPVASASKWGTEGGTSFVGSSMICDATGRVRARLGPRETGVAVADVEPGTPRPTTLDDNARRALLGARGGRRPSADAGRALLRIERAGPGTARARVEIRCAGARVTIDGTGEAVHACGPASVATLPAAQLATFPAARLLALRGVHAIVAFGGGVAPELVRARAAENRVFVVVAGDGPPLVVDPRGQLVECADDPASSGPGARAVCADLDLCQSVSKLAAAGTDVLTAIDPRLYRL